MPTYNYQMAYIGNLANLKASLLISDRISCRVYDSEGSITRRYRNSSFYNLVIKQDVVDGELRIDVAVYEAADTGSPRFALSHGTFRNKVRGLYMIIRTLIIPGPLTSGKKKKLCFSGDLRRPSYATARSNFRCLYSITWNSASC